MNEEKRQQVLKRVKDRVERKSGDCSCVLLLKNENLVEEPLVKDLLKIEGSKIERDDDSDTCSYTICSEKTEYISSLNDHLRSLAKLIKGNEPKINKIINNGAYGSITYVGNSSGNNSAWEILDPDLSRFLGECNLPLFLHFSKENA